MGQSVGSRPSRARSACALPAFGLGSTTYMYFMVFGFQPRFSFCTLLTRHRSNVPRFASHDRKTGFRRR